jgi:hypothetical protein
MVETEGGLEFADQHVIGVAKGCDEEMIKDLNNHFMGECTEVGMYLAMSRQADREGYPLEILCDKVAAELLVPEIYFLKKWETTQDFKYLSRIFKVSPIVIGRRALDLNLINLKYFMDFYNNYMSYFKTNKDKQSSGGDFYATTKKRISLRFAAFVNNAVKENKLLYRDAYRLTSMKGETYNKFINEYLY